MSKIEDGYRIYSINLLLKSDRDIGEVERKIAEALNIQIGPQPLKELKEFISVQAMSSYYNKEDLLEYVATDYRTGEIRKGIVNG